MMPDVRVFRDQGALADATARYIVQTLERNITERGAANLVLSGGQTPRLVYQLLNPLGLERGLDWNRVDLFWGDERSVPPDHAESNFRMVRETLIRHINIPEPNVHRVMSEYPPAEAATHYSAEIRKFFRLDPGQPPVFDLILLGMGEDGHIASIFPGSSAETERNELVTATFVEKLKTHRITMTFPVLNNADGVCILVAGAAKAETLRESLIPGGSRLPVQQIRPVRGKVHLFVDNEAARLLQERNVE